MGGSAGASSSTVSLMRRWDSSKMVGLRARSSERAKVTLERRLLWRFTDWTVATRAGEGAREALKRGAGTAESESESEKAMSLWVGLGGLSARGREEEVGLVGL